MPTGLAVDVPPTLTGVLQARLDALPPPDRQALQLASVIGLTFWDAALAHVDADGRYAGCRRCRRASSSTGRARRAGRADGICEYAFAHQILHQVTYDTVLKRVKRARPRASRRLAGASRGRARARACLAPRPSTTSRRATPRNAAEHYARAAAHLAGIFVHDAALDATRAGAEIGWRRRRRAALAAPRQARAALDR